MLFPTAEFWSFEDFESVSVRAQTQAPNTIKATLMANDDT
jgi:hypothetical protein